MAVSSMDNFHPVLFQTPITKQWKCGICEHSVTDSQVFFNKLKQPIFSCKE